MTFKKLAQQWEGRRKGFDLYLTKERGIGFVLDVFKARVKDSDRAYVGSFDAGKTFPEAKKFASELAWQ